jgi:hypothetical protein
MLSTLVLSRTTDAPVNVLQGADLVETSLSMYQQAVDYYQQLPESCELYDSYFKSLSLMLALKEAFVMSDSIAIELKSISRIKARAERAERYSENNQKRMNNLDLVHSLRQQLAAEKVFRKALRTVH